MVLAVPSSMYGKLINMLMLTLLILVQSQDIIDVKVVNVEMELKDKMVSVIRMDVISVLSEMDIKIFMDLEVNLTLILLRNSVLLLNLLLQIILTMVIYSKFQDIMFKMVKKYLSLIPIFLELTLIIQSLMETVKNRKKHLESLNLLLLKVE